MWGATLNKFKKYPSQKMIARLLIESGFNSDAIDRMIRFHTAAIE
jgi:predicted regulator of amino acid metabolism with ACT domain